MSEKVIKTYDEILETEWSLEFEGLFVEALGTDYCQANALKVAKFLDLCQKAIVMSFHKYGAVADGYGPGVDRSAVGSVPARVERYVKGGSRGDVEIKPGNAEWMTDVFNFAMIEFMHPHEPLISTDTLKEYEKATGDLWFRIERLVESFTTGSKNIRYLVLIAVFACREFVDPRHSKAHFKGTDNASPGRLNLEDDDGHFLSEHRN